MIALSIFGVLSWIKNTDLRLNKFISRRVDYILLFSNASDWRFCPTNVNAANVGSGPLVPLSDDAKDYTVITPAFLLTPYASPYSIVG